jgi:hypothetical protein
MRRSDTVMQGMAPKHASSLFFYIFCNVSGNISRPGVLVDS